MKPQDVIFIIIFLFLVQRENFRLTAIAGLISLILAIPLFAVWKFFTAERLTWYAGAFFMQAIILYLSKRMRE